MDYALDAMQVLELALHLCLFSDKQDTMKLANKMAAFALLLTTFGFVACNEQELLEGDPVLTISTNMILANGTDQAVMKVVVEGVDVTEDAAFYLNEMRYSGNVFTTTAPGNQVLHAVYNNKRTEPVLVKAIDTRLYAELPADNNAEQFDNFAHKVLLTQGTGTWCGYCPYMIRAIEMFRAEQANADKVVVVAAHSGDNLSSKASEAAVKACRIVDFPSSAFNLNYEALISNNDPSLNAVNINSKASMELKEDARVGISAVSKVAGNKVSVRAAVKVGVSGAYRVNAWLVEDGVTDVQSSYWPDFSNGKSSIVMEHDFVLRDASCITPIFGEWLGSKEYCEAGETLEFYHEFNTKESGVLSIPKCKVVVLVSAYLDGSTRFAVNNVVECLAGGSVPFAYN